MEMKDGKIIDLKSANIHSGRFNAQQFAVLADCVVQLTRAMLITGTDPDKSTDLVEAAALELVAARLATPIVEAEADDEPVFESVPTKPKKVIKAPAKKRPKKSKGIAADDSN